MNGIDPKDLEIKIYGGHTTSGASNVDKLLLIIMLGILSITNAAASNGCPVFQDVVDMAFWFCTIVASLWLVISFLLNILEIYEKNEL